MAGSKVEEVLVVDEVDTPVDARSGLFLFHSIHSHHSSQRHTGPPLQLSQTRYKDAGVAQAVEEEAA